MWLSSTVAAHLLKHAMIFFLVEIIGYNITNDELAQCKKKYHNSNYRQNTVPINLDYYKY